MKKKSKFTDKVDYTKSIAFKVYIFILLFGFMLVSSIYIVFSTFNKHEIQEGAYGTTVITAKKINAQLETKLMRMQTLATSLANLGTTMGSNHQENKRVLKKLLDMKGYERFIAGGGIWPEPFVLDSTKERSSYFYARNKNGGLDFYNDYNEPKGSGYHHEEWYVPAKFYEEGKAYYSKSYVDPYSSQPMVTITVPMYKNKKFIGVSTVDVMLDGLQNFLKNNIEELGGYGFIVDRNNKFLSYPDDGKAKFNNNYITLDKLVETTPSFTKLNNTITAYSHLKLGAKCIQMAKYLDKQSEQIDEEESKRISLLIRDSNNKVQLSDEHITMLSIKNDPILKEDSIVISIYKPDTHWNLVIAIPSKSILSQSNRIFSNLILVIAILVFISAVIIYFIMKTLIIKPIGSMIEQLNTKNKIITNSEDEFALLAFWFNKKTDELQEKSTTLEKTNEELDTSHEELSKMNKGLEAQVYSRTKELDIQTKKAQDSTRLKSEFLANMSHEIRTPMNGILGMSHLAMQTDLNDKQKNYIQKIDSSAKSLLRIINDILDFSKIEAGKLTIEKVDFDMFRLIGSIVNLMELKVHEKNLELIVSYDKDMEKNFFGDSLRISQVITNLLGNAIKFTESGEVGIYIKKIKEDRFRFEITDTGIGLTQTQQDKLFQSFSQADGSTTRKYGGTGLGLSISKQLIELMGGEIRVESEVGVGSKFIFEIDLQTKEHKRRYKLFSDKRVLIVDDNESWHDILSSNLEMFNMKVTHAYSGKEAIEIMCTSQVKYDLILMDWNMPDLDGIEVSSQIKNSCSCCSKKDKCSNNSAPVIIMISAFRQDSLVKSAKDIGIDLFLQKPVNPSLLYDILSDMFLDTQVVSTILEESSKSLKDDVELLVGSKILLVEDNTTNQEIILGLLESSGIEIDIANNGKEGVEKFKDGEYELILMDIQMPIMDGYEATKLIREIDSTIPIVALTANAMKEDIQKTKEIGMNEHLNKPIEIEKLYETLLNYISKKVTKSIQDIVEVLDDTKIPNLTNINVDVGLSNLSGNKKLYLKILNDFKNNASDLILEKMDESEFKRTIHTIKGLSANIGATNLKEISEELDKTQDKALLKDFYSELNSVVEELSLKLEEKNEQIIAIQALDKVLRGKLFTQLKEAVNTKQIKKCTPIIQEIDKYILDKKDKEVFEKVKAYVIKFRFKDAIELMGRV